MNPKVQERYSVRDWSSQTFFQVFSITQVTVVKLGQRTAGLCVHDELIDVGTLVSKPCIWGGGTCGPTPISTDLA